MLVAEKSVDRDTLAELTLAEFDAEVTRRSAQRSYADDPGAFAEDHVWIETPDEFEDLGERDSEWPEGERPFKPFQYQRDFWQAWLEEIARHKAGLKAHILHDEKSRQMGMSWAVALFVLWTLCFWTYSWRALVLSYNFDLVDDGGNKSTTDSMFGKIRFMWDRLPDDIKPPLEFRYGTIVNTATGASIIGKTTNPSSKAAGGGGRGGSYLYGIWDEQAFGAYSWQVWKGFKRAVRVPMCLSTPNGKANIFAWLKFRAKGGVRYLRQHWSQHPVYGKDAHVDPVTGKLTSPWYEAECAGMPEEDIASELDIGYETSVKGRALPEFSVDRHIIKGVRYEGGKLFAGWDFGIGATVFSIHEMRRLPDGVEIVTLGACELSRATATDMAKAFKPWLRFGPIRSFGDPAGKAVSQTTGTSIVQEMAKLNIHIEIPMRLRNCQRRIRTTRAILRGNLEGKKFRYYCAADDEEGSSGLAWFAECLEQVQWPVTEMGVVRGDPTDLFDNEYTHHADAFTTAIEGMFGIPDQKVDPEMGSSAGFLTAGLSSKVF